MAVDQEKVLYSFSSPTKVTGQVLLKGIYLLGERLLQGLEERKLNKAYAMEGYQELVKMGMTKQPLDYQKLMNDELNIEKLTVELNKSGIAFNIRDHGDGESTLHFFSKDKASMLTAIKNVQNEILNNPKEFSEKVSKKPNERSFKENVREHKSKSTYRTQAKSSQEKTL